MRRRRSFGPTGNGQVPSQRFTLSSRPRIDFGTAAGPDPTLLSGVVGATRFPSGIIAVGDAGNSRIILIHPRSSVSVAGRAGDGPGEYRIPSWLGRCGTEELGVFDVAHNNLTLVSSSGILRTTLELPPTISFDQIVLCNGEHDLFVLLVHPTSTLTPGESFAVPTVLVRLREGARLDTIAGAGVQEICKKGVSARARVCVCVCARARARARAVCVCVRARARARAVCVCVCARAFIDKVLGKASLVAANLDFIYLCDNQEGLVTVLASSGARKGEFRLDLKRRSLGAAEWNAALSHRLAAHPYARSRVRIQAVLQELKAPTRFPLVDAIRADVSGHLWIKTYDNFSTATATWLVVTETGKAVAAIAMPRALDVREIGADYVLGIASDDDGVQHVVLYDLIRK